MSSSDCCWVMHHWQTGSGVAAAPISRRECRMPYRHRPSLRDSGYSSGPWSKVKISRRPRTARTNDIVLPLQRFVKFIALVADHDAILRTSAWEMAGWRLWLFESMMAFPGDVAVIGAESRGGCRRYHVRRNGADLADRQLSFARV